MQAIPKRGIVTIAFDDAYLDTYKHAITYLDKQRINSTLAIPSSLIGNVFEKRLLMGVKELRSSINSGHEIASHTLTHPNLLRLSSKDKKTVIREISDSKKRLRNMLKCKISSFVFPYINKNQSKSLRLKTKPYYKSARITKNRLSFNKIPIKDPYSVVGFAITKKHSLSYLNKKVDYAQENNLWLIEVFHLVGKRNTLSAHRPKPYRFFMHIDHFKRHIDYILSKDILILTQKDAVERCRYGI